jgi:hypothetical protein
MSAIILLTAWAAVTAAVVAFLDRRLWAGLAPRLRVYLVVAWALTTIGIIQILFTGARFEQFDEGALWFATAGLAISLTGAMNLLNLGRHLKDDGVRRVCLVANLATTAVFVAVATHRGAEPPHDPVSVALMTVAVVATLLGSGLDRAMSSPSGSSGVT